MSASLPVQSSKIDLAILWENAGVAVRLVQIAAYKDFEEKSRRFGQAPRYYGLLGLIETNQGLSQTQLAECLHLVRASLVPILDKLSADGLVERRSDANNSRVRRIWLTPKGKKLMVKLRLVVEQHERRLMAGFSSEEKDTFLRLLRRADANLSQSAGELSDVA
jgi:DNA-binding MarR family transcriptional regulator